MQRLSGPKALDGFINLIHFSSSIVIKLKESAKLGLRDFFCVFELCCFHALLAGGLVH